jgi:hypothetical protein
VGGLIEWLTRLPPKWELRFRDDLAKFEAREGMTTTDSILSTIEVVAMDKGRRQGLRQGRQEGRQEGRFEAGRLAVLEALEVRFGAVPEQARGLVEALADEARLRRAHVLALKASDLKAFLARV